MLTTITVSLNSSSFSSLTIFFHEFVFKGRGREKAQRGRRRSKVNLLFGRKEETNCIAIHLQCCIFLLNVVPSSNCFLKPPSPTPLLFFNNRKKAEEEERLRKEEEAEAAAQIAELDRQLKVIRTLPVGYIQNEECSRTTKASATPSAAPQNANLLIDNKKKWHVHHAFQYISMAQKMRDTRFVSFIFTKEPCYLIDV